VITEGKAREAAYPSNAKYYPLWAAVTICGSGGYFFPLKIW